MENVSGRAHPWPPSPSLSAAIAAEYHLLQVLKFAIVQGVVKCTCSTAVISCLRGGKGHVRANAAPDAVPEAPDDDFEERSPDFDFQADTEID